MKIFENIQVSELNTIFNDEEKCLKYISDEKWKDGFVCKKCGHTNFCAGKKAYSRRCTKCKTEESATANTIFHKCKIALPMAFKLAHLVCSSPDVSISDLATELKIRPMTCWGFKKKITSCIDARDDMSEVKKVELKQIVLGK